MLGSSSRRSPAPRSEPGAALRRLVDELETYRQRYGPVDEPPELARMEQTIGRRMARLDALRGRMSELLDQISRLDEEIVGFRTGYAALLEDTIDRVRRREGEGWSPEPVIGYRLWSWRDGGIHGAREPWPSPAKTASCRAGGDEVPHSDGRCGRLGCGVYAAKDVARLLEEHTGPTSFGYLAGAVELTGKVVEHEHGYRAGHARVVVAVLVGRERRALATDPEEIDALFTDPDGWMATHGRQVDEPTWQTVVEHTARNERRTSWTSETSSE